MLRFYWDTRYKSLYHGIRHIQALQAKQKIVRHIGQRFFSEDKRQ